MGNSGLRKLLFEGDIVESPFRSLHDIKALNLDKSEILLGQISQNKYTIIVNTGSQNPNFKQQIIELNQLKAHNSSDVEVVAIPCNQFHNEPSNFKAIQEKYAGVAQFPVLAKVEINGKYTHPLFKFLKRHSQLYDHRLLNGQKVTQDFCKFLCNKKGEVMNFYPSAAPLSDIQKDIDQLRSIE